MPIESDVPMQLPVPRVVAITTNHPGIEDGDFIMFDDQVIVAHPVIRLHGWATRPLTTSPDSDVDDNQLPSYLHDPN